MGQYGIIVTLLVIFNSLNKDIGLISMHHLKVKQRLIILRSIEIHNEDRNNISNPDLFGPDLTSRKFGPT
jgi:hypothetical protein